MTHHKKFSGLTAVLVLLVALIMGGSATSLDAQNTVQTARAQADTVAVEVSAGNISSDPDQKQPEPGSHAVSIARRLYTLRQWYGQPGSGFSGTDEQCHRSIAGKRGTGDGDCSV